MLTGSDFVHLPYTPDLTEAGVHYACRSFPIRDDFLGKSISERLQRIVAQKAAELAFRRHLSTQELPFETWEGSPFTTPPQYDVALGKRRCILKSLLIPQQSQIHRLQHEPGLLLSAAAILPEEQLLTRDHNDLDLFLFTYVLARTTPGIAARQQAQAAGLPLDLIHPMPNTWAEPRIWGPLSPLTLISELPCDTRIELCGLDQQRVFTSESVQLPAGAHCQVDAKFYTLAYLHLNELPPGRLVVHSHRLEKPYLVQPVNWGNIRIYGSEIILAGWISRGDFRQLATLRYHGNQPFLHPRTSTPHRWLPVTQLNPMHQLFESTRNWANSLH